MSAHKRSPPWPFRPVTDLWLKQVRAALATNDAHNTEHQLRPGDRGYRLATPADLAKAIPADPNALKDLLGGVRAGTKAKQPGRSRLVDRISHLLGIRPVVTIVVRDDRVEAAELLNALPDDRLEEAARELRRLVRESKEASK